MNYKEPIDLQPGDRVEVLKHEEDRNWKYGTIFYIKTYDTNEEYYVVRQEDGWNTDSYKRCELRKV